MDKGQEEQNEIAPNVDFKVKKYLFITSFVGNEEETFFFVYFKNPIYSPSNYYFNL